MHRVAYSIAPWQAGDRKLGPDARDETVCGTFIAVVEARELRRGGHRLVSAMPG